jgi:Gpi18-like mannosyltransferase
VPLAWFAAVACLLFVIAGLSAAYLSLDIWHRGLWSGFPGHPFFDAWTRWDGGWYRSIAERGYYYYPGKQCSVPFFPMYPLLMRGLSFVTRNVLASGMLITLGAGIATALGFHRWCRLRLSPRAATFGLLALILWPFAFYLYFTVYSDALFLALAIGSFLALESDRPLLAGLIAAFATATRPVGLAVAAGLIVRALERSGWSPRKPLQNLRPRDLALLLSFVGVAAYLGYLWVHFGDPFVFSKALVAWNKGQGFRTWMKSEAWFHVTHPKGYLPQAIIGNFLATLIVWSLVPRAIRRFGWGYGVYTVIVLAMPTITTSDFVSMGRYVLAAFPCFAAAGDLLAERPRVARVALVASGALLAVLTSFFARWYYFS